MKTKVLIVAITIVAVGLLIMSASGGMPPVYGEMMLRNILSGEKGSNGEPRFTTQEIDNILALPRLPDFNIAGANITIRSGKQLWVEPDMSFAVIVNVGNEDFEVTKTLFNRRGEQ